MHASSRLDDQLRALFARVSVDARYRAIIADFFHGYLAATADAPGTAAARDRLVTQYLDLLADQFERPFTFAPYHEHITAPFDYYTFGIEFLRPLVDETRSSVRGLDELARAAEALARGENVVFFANHQTEGDPQAISLLLEHSQPAMARAMIFVAGGRVLTDPLAVPFSMGRNLLCVYSKRYMDQPPSDRAAKQRHNRKTMEIMARLLAEGGRCIYVAPSGGRDRPGTDGRVEVAPFDPQSIEMFVLMARRSGRPCHFYPMALATYDMLPPPDTIQVELGERRLTRRSPIHLAVGAAVDVDRFAGHDLPDAAARRQARAVAIHDRVCADYRELTRRERSPRHA
ncbi:MAG TPA: 1-acyl-sn-glycerol-3-phosphate acyltransferase [Vicinamibacterales bacterium]|jgi:glycerol-3-phosphate O-acyltransferase|nr:1-acyl-sn-glycerol-3-phosphate acyltransferase [Vicinamibacterales bacterium]HVZ19684.1 1-acyl-sn-glycerol-3-phosphate acyltransferase [Vicinamibacterales bacterium]